MSERELARVEALSRVADGLMSLALAAEITGDPADGDALGQPIVVAPIPLAAGAPLLLAALSLLGLRRRRS